MMQKNSVITLTCPSCGARVNIEEGARRFTCAYCGNEHLLQFNVQPVAPASPMRPRVVQPNNVSSEQGADGARRLVKRWFSAKYLFLAVFTLFWLGFLAFFYGMMFSAGGPPLLALFPLLHVGVGIYLAYSTLAGFLNRTVVELSPSGLAVWHEPLPWPGSKSLPTAQIRQLYCKEKVTHSKNGARVRYDLYALDASDQEIKVLAGMDSADEARFFEQQLEAWMKITDRAVMGEVGK